MTTVATMIILFVLAVILQGLFAGYETGFVSSNPLRIRHMAEEDDDPRARKLLGHIGEPDRMLTTLLIGTNVAMVFGTMAITGRLGQLTTTLIATPIFLVCSELIPKSIFRAYPNRLSLALLPTIRVFYLVLTPLSLPVTWLTRLMLAVAGRRDESMRPLMASLDDMRDLVDESAVHGNIQPEEREMIHSVIDLQSLHAKEIMVPRIHMQALPDTATRQEAINLFMDSGRTRIPIYHETIDEVIGVVSAHDILCDVGPRDKGIEPYIKDVMHVPDTIKVDDLLKRLRHARQHMAIVTDEYGGTDGLVTLEDILEEIFGEIQDEYDQEERQFHKVGPNAYVVDALMCLEDVADVIGVPMEDEDVETMGGWVMHITRRIPKQGQVIEHGRFRITVLSADPTHIKTIRLEVLPEMKTEHDQEN